MIDFTKFVNSTAVRNHLQRIRYQPTAIEAAWLVWQCETISLEEKYAAWQEIIETLPDCPTGSHTLWLETKYRDSTHTYLQAYIAQQKELTDAFYQTDEPAIYHAEYLILPKGERFWREYRTVKKDFPTLESTLQAISKNDEDIIHITIYKWNANGDFLTAARFLPNHRLAFVDPRPGSMYARNMSKDKWALFTGVLFYTGNTFTWKNIPLPFHSGDILYNPNSPEGMFCGGVFVTTETKSHRCDSGFFLQENKPDTIYHLYTRMIDCEYYPADALPEQYRIFPLISKFLKEKNIALYPRNFAKLINDYHDLLLPPPAAPEADEEDDDRNGHSISIQITELPADMSFEDYVDLMENYPR